jgi:hypothetical protein
MICPQQLLARIASPSGFGTAASSAPECAPMTEIISPAITRAWKRYFTGEPCKYGRVSANEPSR